MKSSLIFHSLCTTLLLLAPVILQAQQPVLSISSTAYTLPAGSNLVLYAYTDQNLSPIDSATWTGGVASFDHLPYTEGMYEVGFSDSPRRVPLVVSPELDTLFVQLYYTPGRQLMQRTGHTQNQILSAYHTEEQRHTAAVQATLRSSLSSYERMQNVYLLDSLLNIKQDSLAALAPAQFIGKYLRNLQGERRFDREKYWDDFPLRDTSLLHSDLLRRRLRDYMRIHVLSGPEQPTPAVLAERVDSMAAAIYPQAAAEVYAATMYTLAAGAYTSGMTELATHIIEKYFMDGACALVSVSDFFTNKALSLYSLRPGGEAPYFTLPTSTGKQLGLEAMLHSSKALVLAFWSSHCAVCHQELPLLVSAYASLHSEGLGVIGLSLDTDRAAWLRGIASSGATWTQVSDLKGWMGPVVQQYHIYKTPTFFLLNDSGQIAGIFHSTGPLLHAVATLIHTE